MADTKQMIERIDVWQCIGCGKIEAPQPCLGVCRDRKAQLVYGDDYDALANEADALRIIVRHIATVNPRAGECERTWQALQTRARAVLGMTREQTGREDT